MERYLQIERKQILQELEKQTVEHLHNHCSNNKTGTLCKSRIRTVHLE